MILILTPNPSLDKTAVVPGFEVGRTFRPPEVLWLAGGKGFNVARALRALGEDSLVVGPLAGHLGRAIRDMAEAEGIACAPLWIAGETRTCLTIVDPTTGRVTEVYEAGPPLRLGDWERVAEAVGRELSRASRLVVCGSFLPGTAEDGLRDLVERARAAGVPALLDTYGPLLARAIAARPALVKINQHEAAGLLGMAIETPGAAQEAATELRARGAQAVVITLGAHGAVGVDTDGQSFGWRAPSVESICAVGSGDSFFGGVVAGLARSLPLAEAVRLGVAAGAANTLRIGAGVFDRTQANALAEAVRPI